MNTIKTNRDGLKAASVFRISCRVCGADTTTDRSRCTNGCCGACHAACCTPGGETDDGHNLPLIAVRKRWARIDALFGELP